MRLLVLDCAANACAAAILDGDNILAALSEPMTRGHAERIAPMLAACLDQAGIRTDRLNAIAVTVGPGAFTGIRIGLSAARGFALAADIPLLGVNCLEVAALPFRGRFPVLIALETKRADFYLQAFDEDGRGVTEPIALPVEEISRYLSASGVSTTGWAVAGDGAERLAVAADGYLHGLHVVTAEATNSAVEAGRIAQARIETLGLPDSQDPGPRPLYLRPPDVNPKASPSPLTAPGSQADAG